MKPTPFLLPLLLLATACAPDGRSDLVFDAGLFGENTDAKVLCVEFVFRDDTFSVLQIPEEFSLENSSRLQLRANWCDALFSPSNLHSLASEQEMQFLAGDAKPKKIEDVRYVLLDLLIPTGNELKIPGDREEPFGFDQTNRKEIQWCRNRVSFSDVRTGAPFAQGGEDSGNSKDITTTHIRISQLYSSQGMRFAYWPFYEKENRLKPAKGIQAEEFLKPRFAHPPIVVGMERYPGFGGYSNSVSEWECIPCDHIVIKEFYYVTLVYEQTSSGWKFLPWGYPNPVKTFPMSIFPKEMTEWKFKEGESK